MLHSPKLDQSAQQVEKRNNRGTIGHFAQVRQIQFSLLSDLSQSDNESLFSINVLSTSTLSTTLPRITASVHKKVDFIIDTAASVNIMGESAYKSLGHWAPLRKKAMPQIYDFKSNIPLPVRGFVMFWPFDPAKNVIQGDAPKGGDTF